MATEQAPASSPEPSVVVGILLLALAYAVAGWLSRPPAFLGSLSQFAAPIWPAAGIALGALLVRGRRLWPGIWLGCLAVTALHLSKTHAPTAALLGAAFIAVGATLQALLGDALVRRFLGKDLALDTLQRVLRFIAFCGPLASLVSATGGVAVLFALGERLPETILINWLFWWSGDTIGALLATPVVLAVASPRHGTWRRHHPMAALPLVIGIAVLAAVLFAVNRLEIDNRRAEFMRQAHGIQDAVRLAFDQTEELSGFVRDFYRASERVSRDQFDIFAGGIHERHSAIQALEWIPRVPGEGLAAHETAVRAEARADYRVFEKAADGGHLPVAKRTEYFPVHFVYPLPGNESALGYDLGSEAMRRQAIETAWHQRRIAASAPIRLIQEQGSQSGVLAFAPLFRAHPAGGEDLVGLTLTVIRVGQLIDSVLGSLATGVAYRLEDIEAPPGGQLLAESAVQTTRPTHQQDHTFDFGGRSWRLVITAGDDCRFAHFAWYSWASLAGAVALAALLLLFLLDTSGRATRVERIVAERTAELEDARRAMEKSNRLLNEAVSSIAQGFTIYDENDRLVVCNEAYRRIYATSADLIVPGNTFEEIVRRGAERGQYQEALGDIDAWVAARVRQHQHANGEVIEQSLGDGHWLMIVEYRTPSGYIVGNRVDITELKRTAAELGERNAQLDAIFHLTPDGLVSFDRAGAVRSVNDAFLRMAGLTAAEVLGRPQAELEARLRERAEAPEQWPGLEPCFGTTGVGTPAPNQPRPMLLALRRPRAVVLELLGVSSDTASVGRLLYLHDVTHEVEVDRMKSEFLSHAAHELRTPMASIYGFSELLIAQEFDAETRRDLLQTIHQQTAWLIEIINELLDLSRIESRRGKDFRIEPVVLAPLVGEALAALQIDPARWPVTLDLPADLPPVRADAAKLLQMLTNVLGNAVKYSPHGGGIAITAAPGSERHGAPQVGITVTDHGIGMTPAQAARVCERFYRADASGNIPGTGLGMAIVKEVAELLGGRIEIASQPGTGTAVTLWLPAEPHATEGKTS